MNDVELSNMILQQMHAAAPVSVFMEKQRGAYAAAGIPGPQRLFGFPIQKVNPGELPEGCVGALVSPTQTILLKQER